MRTVEIKCPDCGKIWNLAPEYASDPGQCHCSTCFEKRNGPPTVEETVELEDGKELRIRSWK